MTAAPAPALTAPARTGAAGLLTFKIVMGVIAVAFSLIIGVWAEPLSIFSNIAVYTFMR